MAPHNNALCAMCKEILDPFKAISSNSIMFELQTKFSMANFVECLRKIEKNGVDLLTIVKAFCLVMDCCYQLGFT